MPPQVISVNKSPTHSFSKIPCHQITLVQGLGIEGDAHAGVTVQHRSRIAKDRSQPNLRQVHLLHCELFEELVTKGFTVRAGDLGENITTRGLDLLGLPTGAELRLGDSAVVRITGLRNPCAQLDEFQPGLMSAVLERLPDSALHRKSGIMAVVIKSGVVRPEDEIVVVFPPAPHQPLELV